MPARGGAMPPAGQRGRSACCAALPPQRYSTRACASSSACRCEQQRSGLSAGYARLFRAEDQNLCWKATAMKAFVVDKYNKEGILRLVEMPEPVLQDKDVLVEIHAAGVNLLDSKIRAGEF